MFGIRLFTAGEGFDCSPVRGTMLPASEENDHRLQELKPKAAGYSEILTFGSRKNTLHASLFHHIYSVRRPVIC